MLTAALFVFSTAAAAAEVADWYPSNLNEPYQYLDFEVDALIAYKGAQYNFWIQHETPIVVYHTAIDRLLVYTCAAMHSDSLLNAMTGSTVSDLPYRASAEMRTNYHAPLCAIFASKRAYATIYPQDVKDALDGSMTDLGLMDSVLADGRHDSIAACLEKTVLSEVTSCLVDIEDNLDTADNRVMTAFTGAIVGRMIEKWVDEGGWNYLGKMGFDGKECDIEGPSCIPWGDYSGYLPGNPSGQINDPTKWMPLVEHDGLGMVVSQHHVVPHIGTNVTAGVIVNDTLFGRQSPDPGYNLTSEMEQVYQRVADISDEHASLVKLMDDKVQVLIKIGGAMNAHPDIGVTPLAARAMFEMIYTMIEVDAVVVTWKEKVRHNLIRPTSYSRWVVAEKDVTGMDGLDVSTKHWSPLIRVMPHAEYPSGSMTICQSVADFTSAFIKEFYGVDELETTWAMGAGMAAPSIGSRMFPKADWETTINLKDLAAICGKSRLWGGMHFTASIEAGKNLVEGYGASAKEWAVDLLGGSAFPTEIVMDPSRVPTTTTTTTTTFPDVTVTQSQDTTPQGTGNLALLCDKNDDKMPAYIGVVCALAGILVGALLGYAIGHLSGNGKSAESSSSSDDNPCELVKLNSRTPDRTTSA